MIYLPTPLKKTLEGRWEWKNKFNEPLNVVDWSVLGKYVSLFFYAQVDITLEMPIALYSIFDKKQLNCLLLKQLVSDQFFFFFFFSNRKKSISPDLIASYRDMHRIVANVSG